MLYMVCFWQVIRSFSEMKYYNHSVVESLEKKCAGEDIIARCDKMAHICEHKQALSVYTSFRANDRPCISFNRDSWLQGVWLGV